MVTYGDVRRDVDTTKEYMKLIRKNRNKSDIVLNSLITLFTECATITSTFAHHEDLVEYFVLLKESGSFLTQVEVDTLLFGINASIKDVEKLCEGHLDNEITPSEE